MSCHFADDCLMGSGQTTESRVRALAGRKRIREREAEESEGKRDADRVRKADKEVKKWGQTERQK